MRKFRIITAVSFNGVHTRSHAPVFFMGGGRMSTARELAEINPVCHRNKRKNPRRMNEDASGRLLDKRIS